MGFWKKLKKISFKPKKAFNRLVKPVLKNPLKATKKFINTAIKHPARYSAGVFTGGTSEVYRAVPIAGDLYAKTIDQLYEPIFNSYANKVTFGISGVVQNVGAGLTEEKPMSLNLGSIFGSLGGILSKTNSSGNPYVSGLGTALSLASSFTPARAAPRPIAPRAIAPKVMAMTPRSSSGGLTQEIFNAGNKVLQRLGIRYPVTGSGFSSALRRSLGSIASLARRTPAGTIINILLGLGLTVLEANTLTAWYSQRRKGRRMNPANSRALRRAVRRIKSFHNLCSHTDLLKTRHRSSSSSGRCGTCKKTRCSC